MKRIVLICSALLILGSAGANAAEENAAVAIQRGTARNEVHSVLGTPDRTSNYGEREIYTLSGGRRAVLRYTGDTLDAGFILM